MSSLPGIPDSMNETVTIHHASIADLEETARLFNEYRRWYGADADLDAARSFLQLRLLGNEAVVFLARDARKAVGFALLYPTFSSMALQSIWILNDLFIAEEHRQHGVGTLLLLTATEFARESGSCRMELETAPENRAAQQLYQRHGWQLCTELQRWTLMFD
ncbi:MAG: GNAT family N-acetyltransferase [Planctomycetaceae bacterium]|nr:GNAT family N-acetyltransferase [Planctomycetaceae bacterium]